jgi:hypothetical protein
MDEITCDVGTMALLRHYCGMDELCLASSWHDRAMVLGDATPEELTRQHGELLAREWIEQNTGVVPKLRRNSVPECYRITEEGWRASLVSAPLQKQQKRRKAA